MLSDLFLGAIILIGDAILSRLPDVSLNSNFLSSVSTASGYMSGLNAILPIGTILTILLFYVTFEGGYLAFKAIYWVIRRLPTQS